MCFFHKENCLHALKSNNLIGRSDKIRRAIVCIFTSFQPKVETNYNYDEFYNLDRSFVTSVVN